MGQKFADIVTRSFVCHFYHRFFLVFLTPPPSSPFVVRILAFTTKHFERIVVKRREEYAWPLLHLSDNWFL